MYLELLFKSLLGHQLPRWVTDNQSYEVDFFRTEIKSYWKYVQMILIWTIGKVLPGQIITVKNTSLRIEYCGLGPFGNSPLI